LGLGYKLGICHSIFEQNDEWNEQGRIRDEELDTSVVYRSSL